jgi:hypothetical protein
MGVCLVITSLPHLIAVPTTPVYRTDFEDVTKKDAHSLNMTIPNWFEFQGDGGAAMWMEGLDRTTPGINCHSGSRCVGMELADITKSRRNEFDIVDLESLGILNEYYVSVWLYLPVDWRLHTPGNWYEIVNAGTNGPTFLPGVAVHLSQPDITKDIFDLDLDARGTDSVLRNYAHTSNYPLPRGRWFNLQYYVFLDPTNGIVKVWIDGTLVLHTEHIPTKNLSESPKTTVGKIYYDTRDVFSPYRIWVDDLEIYNREANTVTFVSLNARLDASSSPPTVGISGSLYPAPGVPMNVTLEFSNNQNGTYQEITRITSAADGTFNYSWRAPGNSVLTIRADAQGVKSPAVSVGLSGVPGFPLESLLVGSALGLILVIMRRREPGIRFHTAVAR